MRRRVIQRLGATLLGAGVLGSVMPLPVAPRRPPSSNQVQSGPEACRRAETTPPIHSPEAPSTVQTAEPVVTVQPVPPTPPACPPEMVLVSGSYCTEVEHTCLHWLDDKTLPFARCGKYAKRAECVGERVHLRFCIDRFESADADGLPLNHQSFVLASRRCKGQKKRLCRESEWNFACEGEEMLPYPYGLERQPKCNQDRSDLFENNPHRRILRDLRQKNDPKSACISPFGVYNMVGNLDEPVQKDGRPSPPFRNALKGGWWMAGRNRCRPATTAHDDYYSDIQIGVRCCSDPLL